MNAQAKNCPMDDFQVKMKNAPIGLKIRTSLYYYLGDWSQKDCTLESGLIL